MVKYLRNDNDIRIVHVLQTMTVVFAAIFKKKFPHFGFDVVNVIMSFDLSEVFMKEFLITFQVLLKVYNMFITITLLSSYPQRAHSKNIEYYIHPLS